MAFAGYLTGEERAQLTDAFLAGGLIGVSRELLLADIPANFVANLKLRPSPLEQFRLDVVEINSVEQMERGIVPIRILLRNVAEELRLRGRSDEARVVERILSRVSNEAAGVPALPDPAQLPEIVENEKIVGDNDLVDLTFLSRGLEVAKSVARIAVPRFEGGQQVTAPRGGPWVAHGTGWLIAPGLAITNHHVINARLTGEPAAGASDLDLQARNATLEFAFDREDETGPSILVSGLVRASAGLDYALLELTDPPALPVPRLAKNAVVLNATTRMAVNIVQHPGGDHKQVAFRNNLVAAVEGDTIRYYTDTDRGSSGSPVCDDAWQVVALHRGAKYAQNANYQGRDEAYVNFGSQIQAILADIRAADQANGHQAIADRIEAGQAN